MELELNHDFIDGRQEVDPLENNGVCVRLKLKAGLCEIREGKGRDAQKAGQMSAGDTEKVMPALMHLLCTLNGRQMPAEDWLDLALSDYARVQIELNNQASGN